jgi:lactate racemase
MSGRGIECSAVALIFAECRPCRLRTKDVSSKNLIGKKQIAISELTDLNDGTLTSSKKTDTDPCLREESRMKSMTEELIFYGDDVKIGRFPEETRFFYPNPAIAPSRSPKTLIADALDRPIGRDPLESRLNSRSHVTIAFDDPCLPVPLMRNDIRGQVIAQVLARLEKAGVSMKNIRLICANGLHRKWNIDELAVVLGKKVIHTVGPHAVSCHDATDKARLIRIGQTPGGMDVEINRAVDESDLTIYVNINFTTMNGGWKSIMVGLGSFDSIRCHHTPLQWNGVDSIMDPATSPMHRILYEMGQVVREKYDIFQIETVINNNLWPVWMAGLLAPYRGKAPSGAFRTASRALFSLSAASPKRVKRLVRNRLRSDYRLIGVHAGDVDRVHPRTLDQLKTQQNIAVKDPVDIVIYGVPNLSPYSAMSVFNPILLRSVVLGYMRGLYAGRSLVRKNGVIIASNPGFEKFHSFHHPSYVDFWNRDLADFRDPVDCWDQLADRYADDEGYLEKYRHQYAYHGTHCLINWFWAGMAQRQVKSVILAGAKEPETARKIGFIPARDLDAAIAMALEMTGPHSSIGYPVMPPLFGVEVGEAQNPAEAVTSSQKDMDRP